MAFNMPAKSNALIKCWAHSNESMKFLIKF